MKKNVGTIDKSIRLLIAAAVVLLYATHIITGTTAIILLIVAAVLVGTVLLSFCPIWFGLRLSTRKKE
jgi:hypothetical protein